MRYYPTPPLNTRLGIHYLPDTLHYRARDLSAWLPQLQSLGITWLILKAPLERAIPEPFLTGLLSAGIEPVLHFEAVLSQPPNLEALRPLLEVYASWGVHYVCMYDRPNQKNSWTPAGWTQPHLVERFLDIYLPWAESAAAAGLHVILPPLEPGGDYWDTAFLHSMLFSFNRRASRNLLQKMVVGAYAWTGSQGLNWGAGGPERWPGARPYHTPEGEQDQLGFRIFDWYNTIVEAVLGEALPMVLMGVGRAPGFNASSASPEEDLAVARLLIGERLPGCDPLPPQLLGAAFWNLAEPTPQDFPGSAWFRRDGSHQPIVPLLKELNRVRSLKQEPPAPLQMAVSGIPGPIGTTPPVTVFPKIAKAVPSRSDPGESPPLMIGCRIAHYLLLPSYEWGVTDWHLDQARPFIKKHRPTVGFQLEEASQADFVTVVGGEDAFSESVLEYLRQAGCRVNRLEPDGTTIAQ